MIDVRQAVYNAQNYLQSIQDLIGPMEDVRLEEVELSSDEKFWLITLGYNKPSKPDLFGNTPMNREYKSFKVDENGKIIAMKIREL